MGARDQLDHVLGLMHKAALGDVHWTEAASSINDTIGARGNNLGAGREKAPHDAGFFFAYSCYGDQRRRDYEERYRKHLFSRDEAVQRILRLPDGQLTPIASLYTRREKRTSRAYAWVRRISSGLYVRLNGPAESQIVWRIANSTERGGHWGSSQIEMIDRLLPHVREYVRVSGALRDAGALGRSLEGLLDNARAAVIQLDRRARIVAANDRARSIMRKARGLSDRGGVLSAGTPGQNDELQRLLARALPPFGVQPSSGSMLIDRPGARTRLAMHVTPVPARAGDLRTQKVAALVLVIDPEHAPGIDPGIIARALNLTPAESRLAAMLAAGHSVRYIAAATGRKENTVRWHLKKIFRKQGVSRQSELVRRVLSLEGFPTSPPE